jgi:hypothetical protein
MPVGLAAVRFDVLWWPTVVLIGIVAVGSAVYSMTDPSDGGRFDPFE